MIVRLRSSFSAARMPTWESVNHSLHLYSGNGTDDEFYAKDIGPDKMLCSAVTVRSIPHLGKSTVSPF